MTSQIGENQNAQLDHYGSSCTVPRRGPSEEGLGRQRDRCDRRAGTRRGGVAEHGIAKRLPYSVPSKKKSTIIHLLKSSVMGDHRTFVKGTD